MNRADALADLIAKVEAGAFDAPPASARAPFFNAFMDIAETALPQNVTGCSALAWRAYNAASLDAALAMHQAVLPGWWWYRQGFVMFVTDDHTGYGSKPHFSARDDANPARAWLLAILKALHAQMEPTP